MLIEIHLQRHIEFRCHRQNEEGQRQNGGDDQIALQNLRILIMMITAMPMGHGIGRFIWMRLVAGARHRLRQRMGVTAPER